jgi:hypothetical protein
MMKVVSPASIAVDHRHHSPRRYLIHRRQTCRLGSDLRFGCVVLVRKLGIEKMEGARRVSEGLLETLHRVRKPRDDDGQQCTHLF